MHRRKLLWSTAVGATGLLAGCLDGEEPSGGTGTPDGDGSTPPTDESTPRPDEASPTGTGSDGSDDAGAGTPTDDGAETPTETDEDTPTETDRETATDDGSGSNEMVGRSFEVVGTECGQGVQRATVERSGNRVDVDGTIRGQNGCYTAELEDATYDEGADELTVAVRAVDGSSDRESCQECIVDVDYRATFEFRDGTPDEVSVHHDGDHVTTE